MRYIKPPDFKSVKELQEFYRGVENEITELLTADASIRTADELNKKLGLAISAAVSYLGKANKEFATKELPSAFKEGQGSIKDAPKYSAKEAAKILEKQGFKYAKNGLSKDTYIELQTATESAGKRLKSRVNKIVEDLSKKGQDSVYNVQQTILKDLQQNGLLTVTYSNGAKQSLNSYAAMAARSARIESTNIGAIGSALQSGTDLVIMTTMPQCCKLCGAYQDKVYSISGKDKRFPALFKTVLKNGYALPHPNCRHEFIPWYEDMEAPEDVEKAIRKSKIKYDRQGGLVDVRHQADIEGYQQWQVGNRQLNRELHEYEQMQAYYENKGEEAPYKTLGAFRRARRAQAQSYKDNRKEWNTMKESIPNGLTNWKYSGRIGKEPNPNAETDCAVSWKRINNKKHRDGVVNLVADVTVGKAVSNIESEILKHRNGKEQEDLYLVDARTGKTVAKNTQSKELLKVESTKEMKDLLSADDKRQYVLIHNHPYNSPPSIADLNSLAKNPKIKYGIIVGHNGTVYKYTAPSSEIPEDDLDLLVKKYRSMNYSEKTAREKAYKVMMKKYNFKMEIYEDGK